MFKCTSLDGLALSSPSKPVVIIKKFKRGRHNETVDVSCEISLCVSDKQSGLRCV